MKPGVGTVMKTRAWVLGWMRIAGQAAGRVWPAPRAGTAIARKRGGIQWWRSAGLACILLAPAAFAQTGAFIRTTDADQWDLMSVPLVVNPSNRFGIVASNATYQTTVYFYDSGLTNFSSGTRGLKGWTAAISNRVVLPGEGFFLHASTNAGYAMNVQGEVPGGPVTNQVHERWSALGYPFPDEIAWTDTSLASDLPVGSIVYFWDTDLAGLKTFRKGPPAKGGWGAASNHVLSPGDGFIVRQPPGSTPFLWTQERGE